MFSIAAVSSLYLHIQNASVIGPFFNMRIAYTNFLFQKLFRLLQQRRAIALWIVHFSAQFFLTLNGDEVTKEEK
jgi:hypothetical protein